MREETRRLAVTATAVVAWCAAMVFTLLSVVYDADDWRALLPLTVGVAIATTVARYVMRTRHIMSQVYRAGRDSAKREGEDEDA